MAYADYIFDLYGTLVDILTDESLPALWEETARLYASHGADYTGEELRARYLALCGEEQAREADPLFEIELRTVFRRLYEEKAVLPSAALVEETAVLFRRASTIRLGLYPWVKPVFRRIREEGARIFLLSNAQSCFTLYELEKLGLSEAFDGIALSSDYGVKKPSPRFMGGLIERYGIDPAAALMTGNDQHTDVASAKAFGMDALYVKTAASGKYDPALKAEKEIADGDFSKLYPLMGLIKKPKYEYVFFDLDGTLVDSSEGITSSVEYALNKFGIFPETRAELNKFIGPPLVDSFMRFYGFSEEQAGEAVDFYRETYRAEGVYRNRVYDGIRELLAALVSNGVKPVLATSKPEVFAGIVLDSTGLKPYFAFAAGAELDDKEGRKRRLRLKKEDVIAYALDSLGITEPGRALMVGDRLHDIVGARMNGMDSVGVLFGFGGREELENAGADHIVKEPMEILSIALEGKNTL